jgi:putative tryptophan/tyrosine transport system substrate-binding protein
MFTERSAVLEGGLASYGADYRGVGRLAASYVYRVLHGTNPRDLPIANIDRLELVVNARTARR